MDKPSLLESESDAAEGSRTFDQRRIYPALMQGDQTAWTEFFVFFRGILDHYFRRNQVVREQDREELLQETMKVIFSSLDNYDPELHPLQHWVFGIAKNVRLRWYQRSYLPEQRNELDNDDGLNEVLGDDGDVAENAEIGNNLRIQLLRAALRTLSASHQQILKLRSERDEHLVTFTDIGQELGIGPGAARMRHKRACDQLRKAQLNLQVESKP